MLNKFTNLFSFIMLYPMFWVVSRLNFYLLFKLSDFLFYIFYYIIRYRRQTVRHNLTLVFPEKSKKEIKNLELKTYKNLTDIILESIKFINMTEDEVKERFQFKNIEVLKELEKTNQDLIVMCGHYASWEWVFILDRFVKYDIYGVYKQLSNPYFDKVIKESRSKFNGKLISTKEAIPRIGKNTKSKDLCLYGFASDQTPKLKRAFHWGKFMNVHVPIHTGAEMLAKKYNLAIAFLSVEKIKRGYYMTTFEKITTTPRDYKDFEISDLFIKKVEKQIIEAPEFYTWTHKRWKHKDKDPSKKL